MALSEFYHMAQDYERQDYLLEDDGYIWEILLGCKTAHFVSFDAFPYAKKRNKISFAMKSEMYGTSIQVFTVTEDGYLKTDVFYYSYQYEIGPEAAI